MNHPGRVRSRESVNLFLMSHSRETGEQHPSIHCLQWLAVSLALRRPFSHSACPDRWRVPLIPSQEPHQLVAHFPALGPPFSFDILFTFYTGASIFQYSRLNSCDVIRAHTFFTSSKIIDEGKRKIIVTKNFVTFLLFRDALRCQRTIDARENENESPRAFFSFFSSLARIPHSLLFIFSTLTIRQFYRRRVARATTTARFSRVLEQRNNTSMLIQSRETPA